LEPGSKRELASIFGPVVCYQSRCQVHRIALMQFLVLLGIHSQSIQREVLNAELVGREIQAVKDLAKSGTVRHAWKRQDCHCIALLVDAQSEQDCRALLVGLPFSQAGILDIQLLASVEPFSEVYSDSSVD
jgi:muconolactone delta-isomerase